ncbi:MAG: phosphate acyltransferase [Bilophila wadsworthia]
MFGDCAVNPNPTASQLADIAISSAHTARVRRRTPRRHAVLLHRFFRQGRSRGRSSKRPLAHERLPSLLMAPSSMTRPSIPKWPERRLPPAPSPVTPPCSSSRT